MEAIAFSDSILEFEDYAIPRAEKLFIQMKLALDDIAEVSTYISKQDVKGVRTLKITEHPYASVRLNYKPAPFIRIAGRWVEKAGFQVGDFAQVITIQNMVLIVPVHVPLLPQL